MTTFTHRHESSDVLLSESQHASMSVGDRTVRQPSFAQLDSKLLDSDDAPQVNHSLQSLVPIS